MSILTQLKKATGLDRNPDEVDASYARRLADGVDKISDGAWKKLPEEAQVWVNNALEALQLDKPLPSLDRPVKIKKPRSEPPKKSKERKPDTRPIMTTGKISRSAVIRILVKKNPHEEGTRPWWAFSYYRDGMTVEEAYNRCVGWTNIVWDKAAGYIDLE